MPSKKAVEQAKAEYEAKLKEAEEMEDDPAEDEDDIIILRGNARAEFMDYLRKSGYTVDEANEEAEEVEEEVAEETGTDEEDEEVEPPPAKVKKAAVKTQPKKAVVKKVEEEEEKPEGDPSPKSRHRFFG